MPVLANPRPIVRSRAPLAAFIAVAALSAGLVLATVLTPITITYGSRQLVIALRHVSDDRYFALPEGLHHVTRGTSVFTGPYHDEWALRVRNYSYSVRL